MNIKAQYNNLPAPAKASLWFTITYIIQRGIQFISMPIFTRLMNQEEYGTYSVFLSWFNLLVVFSTLNIYSNITNKALVKFEQDKDRYLSSVLILTLIVGSIISILIIGFKEPISQITGFSYKILLLMCIHILSFPSFQFWAQKQRFYFKYKGLLFTTLLTSILNIIIGIIFISISSNKSDSLITTTVLIQFFINSIFFFNLLYKGDFTCFHKKYWKWSILLAIPLIPHYLSEILLGHADRIMINSMCGSAEAGIYNIVYQISMVMTIIRTGINGSYTPWLYQSMKKRKYESINDTTNIIIYLMFGITAIFMLMGPELLFLAAPPSYHEAIIDIPAIMIGCYSIFIYILFLNIEIYYEYTRYVTLTSCIAAIVNICLNLYCIPIWGYLSAGYTTMFSYMLMAILHYIFYIRIQKQRPEIKNMFNIKLIFLSLLLLMLMALLLIFLYKTLILRWIFILSIIIILSLKRNLIFNYIQSIKSK